MNTRGFVPLDRKLNMRAMLERSPSTPAIKVAGVPVHSYVEQVKGGLGLVVSIHGDGEPHEALLDADGNVRMRVNINGTEVFPAELTQCGCGAVGTHGIDHDD
jgi:hypothetical protein